MGFICRSRYDTHMQSHSGTSTHGCPHCWRCFKYAGGLTEHLKKKICAPDAEYTCESCEVTFPLPVLLQKHERTHGKEYSCEICKNGFDNLRNLRLHVQGKKCMNV